MIKFIHCVKARPELTAAEFRKFFRGDELLSLTRRMATLTNAVDYELGMRLEIEINTELMRSRDGAAPFDGVIEIHWESGRELMQSVTSEEFQALMEQMQEYQSQFVDFSQSSRFFMEV